MGSFRSYLPFRYFQVVYFDSLRELSFFCYAFPVGMLVYWGCRISLTERISANMKQIISLLLLLLSLAACAAPVGETVQTADTPPVLEEETEPPAETDEPEDHVLLTLEAPLADGRTLTLEAFGKVEDEYTTGVREVRVYDRDTLIQTVQAREGNMAFWGDSDLLPGESVSEYTSCWKPEGCMEAVDLNFDGNTDLGLFAFRANNTIPYFYWIWNTETGRYQYAFTLQGAEAHPETGELTSEYKSGSAGSQWIREYYRPDEHGEMYLDRVERNTCDFEPEKGYLDFDRGWAEETWVPPEGMEPIRPDNGHWSIEADLVLVYRKVPTAEVNADSTVSHYTDFWELKDGTFQMTSREEFIYEDQP